MTTVYREYSAINMAITISKMSKNDTHDLSEIDRIIFNGSFKEQDFIDYLDNSIYHFAIAKIDEKTVGYIGFMTIFGESDIINVGVLPEYRGLGIGNELLSYMIDDCKKNGVTCVHLEVRKSNNVAISLYEKFGFIATGVSKNHYKDPTEDAIRMTLSF